MVEETPRGIFQCQKSDKNKITGATLGFEQTLWKAGRQTARIHATPRNISTSSLGLMFLKYISDGFEETAQEAGQPEILRR